MVVFAVQYFLAGGDCGQGLVGGLSDGGAWRDSGLEVSGLQQAQSGGWLFDFNY